MKKLISILALSLLMAGCAFDNPPGSVAVKYKYVVVTAPDEMFVVPPQVPPIDTKTATDKDAAKWLVDSEARSIEIEKRLEAVKSYLADKIKNLGVPKEDIIIK